MGRVLVVGAGAGVGRSVARGLAAEGIETVALTSRPPRWAGTSPTVHAVTDAAAVARLADGCEVVVYCARPRTDRLDSTTTARVLAAAHSLFAAASAGRAHRVVLLRRPALAPAHGGDDDRGLTDRLAELAAASSLDVVTLRVAPVVGRGVGDALLAALSQLSARLDPAQPMQVVHEDDLARAVAAMCTAPMRGGGDVGLAAPGVVPAASLARALGVRRPRGDARVEWIDPSGAARRGIAARWAAADAVDDLRLAAMGASVGATGVHRRPGRLRFRLDLPPPDQPADDGRALEHAAPEGVRGELDTPFDPRFPTYSSVNLSEALPGPATPLSLTTVGRGTAAAGTAFIDLVPVGGVLETEAWSRAQGVRGHRVYVNISYACALADIAPGMDVDAVAEQFVGRSAGTVTLLGDEPCPDPVRRGRAQAALLVEAARRMTGLMRSHRRESDAYVGEVARLAALMGDPARLDDARLADATRLARDLVIIGWVVGGRNVLAVQMLTQAAERLAPGSVLAHAGDELLASAAPLVGVRRLAAAARQDPAVADLLRAGAAWPTLRDASPAWGAMFEQELAAFGHRGPGECELENPTFADRPEMLLRAIAHSLDIVERARPARPESGRRLVAGAAATLRQRATRAQVVREHARDHLVRATDLLRRAAREQGRRLAARGLLAEPTDVFFLCFDELFSPPPDAAATVTRRRAERHRLAAVRVPPIVSGGWTAAAEDAPLLPGARLTGAGASPGTATGRVRVVDIERIDDLRAGEILVANVTDVGYTSVFGCAAAVVTDVGGLMSHAAVVAREYGIPAVVDTGVATVRLADGMLVEVDGSSGVVTVLADR